MKANSVQLCCFSPPHWGLRKYSVEPLVWGGSSSCCHVWGDTVAPRAQTGGTNKSTLGSASGGNAISDEGILRSIERSKHSGSSSMFCQLCGAWKGDLGLEPTPEMYLDHMMLVMAEVWRALRDDGVCFVNIGDSYAGSMKGVSGDKWFGGQKQRTSAGSIGLPVSKISIKNKSLCLVPQRFAIRCQEQGWVIRSEIIWAKPNPMPESVKDRPTRSHEQVWMMTKRGRYFWDQDAVREPHLPSSIKRYESPLKIYGDKDDGMSRNDFGRNAQHDTNPLGRNVRDVWTIPTEPTPEAHFATWPSKLVKKMIRAASRPGDIVLDPFCGTGKTVIEAERLSRVGIGLDLSWPYLSDIAVPRKQLPLQRELLTGE